MNISFYLKNQKMFTNTTALCKIHHTHDEQISILSAYIQIFRYMSYVYPMFVSMHFLSVDRFILSIKLCLIFFLTL